MPDNSFRKQPAFTTPVAYGKNNAFQNVFPDPLIEQRAPTTADTNYLLGQIWFDQPNEIFYQYAGSGTWQEIAAQGGSGSFSSLTVTGTTNINNSGSAVTTIGTGGTGAVNIGNATGNTNVTGSLTASTGLVATTGGVTATAGDITINGAGAKLRVQGGAVTDFIGSSVLVLGTVTIANTNIAAGDRIFLSRTAANASTALGELTYTISAGASFTVTSLNIATPASTQTGDLSSFVYVIIREI